MVTEQQPTEVLETTDR